MSFVQFKEAPSIAPKERLSDAIKYRKMGDNQTAINLLECVIKEFPHDRLAHIQLGKTYFYVGNYEATAELMLQALQLEAAWRDTALDKDARRYYRLASEHMAGNFGDIDCSDIYDAAAPGCV